LYELRQNGLRADKDYLGRKMKAQLKSAERLNAKFAAILGEDELNKGEIILKTMKNFKQEPIKLNELVTKIKEEIANVHA
jgi:histidyl-tRNA synthetase